MQTTASGPPNVLFIGVDDLRPELASYGKDHAQTPNIDRLATQGILFERAYVQVPVCGASRASILSGLRPTRTRFINYYSEVRIDAPDATTLPAHFKNHGYVALGNGKVFHSAEDAPEAWSEPAWRPVGAAGNWRDYLLEENRQTLDEMGNGRGPAFEQADVPDSAYSDGKIAARSIEDLRRLAAGDEPFFLAVGFLKPHLPFNAPAKYWDRYDSGALPHASNPYPPKDAPEAALHNWGELRNYHGVPASGPVSDDYARRLVHGYLAATSYTDALVGDLLDELDALGLSDDTIVVLWGDHGWQLGEHGLWCKHCNFETSLHAPLIMRVPGEAGGKRVGALTEFVDVYPTLCELAGLPLPDHLAGTSLVPQIMDPDSPGKEAALSRFHNGDSYRTDRYRYTEWTEDDGTVYARMLYDHLEDPDENLNLAGQPAYQELVDELSNRLAAARPVN